MAKSKLHDDAMIDLLRDDPSFIHQYLHHAFLDVDEPGGQEAFLIALRYVVEATGGMTVVAQKSGLSRDTLYRALSPHGNPTLKTLRSITSATGYQFSTIANENLFDAIINHH